MATLIHPHLALADRHALVRCPTCRHQDRAVVPLVERLLVSLGGARTCAYAVGDEISPLRNESCGCDNPVHTRGQR